MHRKLFGILTGICCLGISASAQKVSAGITVRDTDPSGAAIGAAKVTAKDLDRGTTWPTVTNDNGIFTFPRAPPGR